MAAVELLAPAGQLPGSLGRAGTRRHHRPGPSGRTERPGWATLAAWQATRRRLGRLLPADLTRAGAWAGPTRGPRGGSLVLPPRPGWRDLAGRCWHARPPAASAPPTNPAPEPTHGRQSLIHGRLRWLHRLPLVLSRHATVSTGPRFHEDGQTARPGNRKGQHHDRGQRQLRRQPHRRPRAAAHRGRDRPGHVPGGGVGSAGAGGVVLHRGRVARPGRACGRVVVQGQPGRGRGPAPAAEPGPPRMAAPDRWSRSWPRSWGRACGGRRRRRPGRRGARASSQLDHDDGTGRKAKHASVPFRHVCALELRCKKFLYELKAGPAGGRLRRPSSAGVAIARGGCYGDILRLTLFSSQPTPGRRSRRRCGRTRCSSSWGRG